MAKHGNLLAKHSRLQAAAQRPATKRYTKESTTSKLLAKHSTCGRR